MAKVVDFKRPALKPLTWVHAPIHISSVKVFRRLPTYGRFIVQFVYPYSPCMSVSYDTVGESDNEHW